MNEDELNQMMAKMVLGVAGVMVVKWTIIIALNRHFRNAAK